MTDTQIIHQFAEQNMLVERYLLGELRGLDLEDFERHMFECSICFEAVKAGQEFTQHLKDAAASGELPLPLGVRAKAWLQRIKAFWARHFRKGTTSMILALWQLGPLPSPPPQPDYRPEFEFWAQACLCLFFAAVMAACLFVLLFRYSERFRELCAGYVEKHGTPLSDESKGGV
jgi:hypothetical protein